MFGLISPVSAAELTVNQVKNRKYFIPSFENPAQGEWVKLKHGKYIKKDPNDPLFVNIMKVAFGHLSNDKSKDAAVIYGYNTGGSGVFVVLCAVINDQGQPQNIGLIDLGDRPRIKSLRIKSGKIFVNMVTHGPNDPSCCPTVKKIATYTLVGNKLVEN